MHFFYKILSIFSIFLIPITGFSSEKSAQVKSGSFGYYDFNIGDYSKPREHHYLPEKGVGTIKTKLGDVFSVTFPASPSTGSSWALRRLPTELLLLDSTYNQSDECKDGMTGCSGFTTYTFKSLKKGVGTVIFQYGRQWENDDSIIRTVKVTVK
ncbi:protease inhibitor I42 family protein [Acinetobacter soli]|uniref:Proteinase inhibitor I42 chagasin domain-containing protein n=1 Tax=Acinetobacter soli TaxID=487316 RepID=A0A1P8ENG8_9GAMM|nr:protease inhibitor I42 family protein [Acinetobacter soli]APV37774.1 hypothetical protein BEN76_17130 [Acinetobacter soli]